mmetsp:Transcript_109746/g.317332  ORF Transcript_109746/g.317332 Transcript_109746/m.317332 type:complete len:357 (-) Transcript_109746:274-1344(-)
MAMSTSWWAAVLVSIGVLGWHAQAVRHLPELETGRSTRCVVQQDEAVKFVLELSEETVDGSRSLASRISLGYYGLDPQWVLTQHVPLRSRHVLEFAQWYISRRCETDGHPTVLANEEAYDMLRKVVLAFAADLETCTADFGDVRIDFSYKCLPFQEERVRLESTEGLSFAYASPSRGDCGESSGEWACDLEAVRRMFFRKWDELMVLRPRSENRRMVNRTRELFNCKFQQTYRDCTPPAQIRNMLKSFLKHGPDTLEDGAIRPITLADISDAALLAVVPTEFLSSTSVYTKASPSMQHKAVSSVARAALLQRGVESAPASAAPTALAAPHAEAAERSDRLFMLGPTQKRVSDAPRL